MTPGLSDPRLPSLDEAEMVPIVGRPGKGPPLWLMVGLAVLAAILLFSVLESRRQARAAPSTQVRIIDGVQMPSALPPLLLPARINKEEVAPPPPPPPPTTVNTMVPPQTLPPSQPMPPSGVAAPPSGLTASFSPASPVPTYLPPPQITETAVGSTSGEILIIDTTLSSSNAQANGGAASTGADAAAGQVASSGPPTSTQPVRAQQLGRRSTTVPQGTLIPAVLETALDSTRPGYVRAMITRDVTGFDGTRVLIPRGSRLVGDYKADLSAGQKRAVVQWTRLVRPDGVAIALESPAADRVGRAGIGGRVDNHFLQRFSSAILQSTMNFGSSWAGRSIGGDTPVVIALPGSTQGTSTSSTGSQIQPTLRVDAGVTVTVFVARDLEFPPARTRR